MDKEYSRRVFFKRCFQQVVGGSALLAGSMFLGGCQSGEDSSPDQADPLDVDSCDDLSKVSEAELKKRKGFGYVEETPIPDKKCENCNLYIPPKEGQACGGCILFEGPVFEEGYCTYWAPQET
ncbi:high-potential iron-sulfur protein [Fodinibius sediminis]|uniref:High-potential iron-sulfur protein n=1 Tax=Fodinibius sediminis TaxID=1214077 RepID=A0A521CV70_9BACT|nr:high-potential iron-sulfur protein [Fodinibius sediminis]SMO62560.1 High potential iron-sulfur protein [Fodinibius sediminis]